ncbi:hypothetical protein Tsubulata_030618 [Turnera subulata]|uniref:PB1 domain-containing protein n=1 Tax=Turnera subulata TaxID=218843 RepID=A0A9Q0GJI7_9ROSI|nr:hypothetical protein Tsubulata_030618 [Turnera subulata]
MSKPSSGSYQGIGTNSSPLVIKVSHGDSTRRMTLDADENGGLMLNFNDLKTKIYKLLKFEPNVDFSITYTDEDGDTIALVDDGDISDILRQRLNPLRLVVKLKGDYNPKPDHEDFDFLFNNFDYLDKYDDEYTPRPSLPRFACANKPTAPHASAAKTPSQNLLNTATWDYAIFDNGITSPSVYYELFSGGKTMGCLGMGINVVSANQGSLYSTPDFGFPGPIKSSVSESSLETKESEDNVCKERTETKTQNFPLQDAYEDEVNQYKDFLEDEEFNTWAWVEDWQRKKLSTKKRITRRKF